MALVNVLEFEKEGADLVYCCTLNDLTVYAAKATRIFQMIHVAMYSTTDAIANQKHYPFFNRIVPEYRFQSQAALELVRYFYEQSNISLYLDIAIIVSSTDFGIAGANDLITLSKGMGVNIIEYQQFLSVFDLSLAALDLSVEVSELKSSGSRVFIAIMETVDFALLLNRSMEYGLVGEKYVWICFDGCANPYTFINVVTHTTYEPTRLLMQGVWGINQVGYSGPQYEELAKQVLEMDKTIFPVDSLVPTLVFQYIYDGVYFIATALHRMIEENGISHSGKIMNMERFNQILRNTTIDGVTGVIQLTPEGDRLPAYDIVNLQSNNSYFSIVGRWSEDKGIIIDKEYEFYGGSKLIPDIDVRPPFAYWNCPASRREVDLTGKSVALYTPDSDHSNSNISIDYYCDEYIDCSNISDEGGGCATNYVGLFIAFGICTGVLILVAILFLIITIIFGLILRWKRFISASPVFLIIIIISCIMGYAAVYAFTGRATKVGCAFRPWLLCLSINSMVVALCAKTFRIWRIFRSPFRRKVIGDLELLFLWFIMILPAIIILILWTIIATPTAQRITVDGMDHYDCKSGGFSGMVGGYVFFAIILGYTFLVLIFGAFLSFVTRDVPALFNESKLISISIYHLVFLAIVVIPVDLVIKSVSPYSAWIIRSTGILYAFTATLFIQFIPKILAVIVVDRCKNTPIHSSKGISELEHTEVTTGSALDHIKEADDSFD